MDLIVTPKELALEDEVRQLKRKLHYYERTSEGPTFLGGFVQDEDTCVVPSPMPRYRLAALVSREFDENQLVHVVRAETHCDAGQHSVAYYVADTMAYGVRDVSSLATHLHQDFVRKWASVMQQD